MQHEIDKIMRDVTCSATAEIARQALQELASQQERRATEMELERDALRQRAEASEQERNAVLVEQAASHREIALLRQRVTTLEEEQDGLLSKFCITRRDDLLRHVLSATVDFSNFTVRKVVSGRGSNGIVLLCSVTVPAWCVPSDSECASIGAAAAQAGSGERRTEVMVAVKVLAGVQDPRHTTLKHRFLREFQTLSAIPPHPNVITLLAYLTKSLPTAMYDLLPDGFRLMVGGAANPVLALIMPLHPRTLAAAAATAEPAQLLRWCLEVAVALAHMWEYGWVHLDLKLDNVLVAGDGRAVLTDMGTAMPVAADGSLTLPAHMGLEGNRAHHAPEVHERWEDARRDPTSMVRIDAGRQEVWALGVLLHELVGGKHPYGEEYPFKRLGSHAAVDEEKLIERGLPAATVAVLRRMTNSEPTGRLANPPAAYAELMGSVPAAQRPLLASIAPTPALASAAIVAVSLHDVERAYVASQLNIGRDPASGKPVANEWGRQLQAWSEHHDASRLCLAMLLWHGWGGMRQNEAAANALAERSIAWCRGAAKDNEPVAQWLLGWCFIKEVGVGRWSLAALTGQENKNAARCFQRAAAQGHADSQFDLGLFHATGRGVSRQDQAQAVIWWQQAAEQGHAKAQCKLGMLFAKGRGVVEDQEQAVAWYRRAAEQGLADAQAHLGTCFATGTGVKQDQQQAAAWCRRAAEQGHAKAQYSLGAWTAEGAGVVQDQEQAVEWWRHAAEQGHAGAQLNVGLCYESGKGVEQDQEQAAAWYRRAAEQGHAEALTNLGACYADGRGVSRNQVQAASWYRRAAVRGHAQGQCNLGMCYANGKGVALDYKQAVAWYRRAAEQGHALAQFNLGLCYTSGAGVAADQEQAVAWYRRAAEQGHADAQCSLAACYANGDGVRVDMEQAMAWFLRAAEQGHAEAEAGLQHLTL